MKSLVLIGSNMPKRNQFLITTILQAFDAVEGVYSGIPECCIIPFMNGRTYQELMKEISQSNDEKKLMKNLKAFNYVPCYDCLRKKKVAKLKHNGVSPQGRVLMALAEGFTGKKDLDYD